MSGDIFKFRAPPGFPEMVADAAKAKGGSASEYARRAILNQLAADGFNPEKLPGLHEVLGVELLVARNRLFGGHMHAKNGRANETVRIFIARDAVDQMREAMRVPALRSCGNRDCPSSECRELLVHIDPEMVRELDKHTEAGGR